MRTCNCRYSFSEGVLREGVNFTSNFLISSIFCYKSSQLPSEVMDFYGFD